MAKAKQTIRIKVQKSTEPNIGTAKTSNGKTKTTVTAKVHRKK